MEEEFDIGKKIIEIMKSDKFKGLNQPGREEEKSIATSILANMNPFHMMCKSGKKKEAFGILESLYKKYPQGSAFVDFWLKNALGETAEYGEFNISRLKKY